MYLDYNQKQADADLIALCNSGDRNAWDSLLQRVEKPIYKFAYSLCHHHEEAQDIAGQALLRLYQNLATFRNESSFTTWLFCIVRNIYYDFRLSPANRASLSLCLPLQGGTSTTIYELRDPSPSPEKLYIEKETAQEIAKAIQHLPAYQRQVLRRYHFDDGSYEEIAIETGLSIGTVKSRLNRARTMLRERLNDTDFSPFAQERP